MGPEIRKRLIIGGFIVLSTLLMLLLYLPEMRKPLYTYNGPQVQLLTKQTKLTEKNGRVIEARFLRNRYKLILVAHTSGIQDSTQTLNKMIAAVNMLPGQKSSLVKVVLVCLSSNKEGSTALKEYLKTLDKNILILTGSTQEMLLTLQRYNIVFQKPTHNQIHQKKEPSDYIYLLDKSDYLTNHFSKNVPPLTLSGQLRNLF
jgi:cytochrome oxidase Cu insertion factor (SCO1/SenC/PrrC family)